MPELSQMSAPQGANNKQQLLTLDNNVDVDGMAELKSLMGFEWIKHDVDSLHNLFEKSLSPLYEALGVAPDDAEFANKVAEFLYDFSNNLGWSEEDRFVWPSRSVENMKSAEVASHLKNRSCDWVYTRFCRLNRLLKEAIAVWWNNQRKYD